MNINLYKLTFLLYQLLIFLNLFHLISFRQRDCKKKVSTCGRFVTTFYLTWPMDRKPTTYFFSKTMLMCLATNFSMRWNLFCTWQFRYQSTSSLSSHTSAPSLWNILSPKTYKAMLSWFSVWCICLFYSLFSAFVYFIFIFFIFWKSFLFYLLLFFNMFFYII